MISFWMISLAFYLVVLAVISRMTELNKRIDTLSLTFFMVKTEINLL